MVVCDRPVLWQAGQFTVWCLVKGQSGCVCRRVASQSGVGRNEKVCLCPCSDFTLLVVEGESVCEPARGH